MRGYASASTDTGHLESDQNWGKDRAKEIDYGHRGTHVTAVAGKALTGSFYGQAVQHAYFEGCSNGGRQALMEVQRYPEDFDGIIAGDPATGTPMQAGRALVYQKMLASNASYLHLGETGTAVEGDARRVRQDRRPAGWPHHRSPAVQVRPGHAEVRGRRRAQLPDRGSAGCRQADLQRREAGERRNLLAPLPGGPRGKRHRVARVDFRTRTAGTAIRRHAGLRGNVPAEWLSVVRAEHALSRAGRR